MPIALTMASFPPPVPHPLINLISVVHHAAHGGVEAEHPVGDLEPVQRIFHVSHAANHIGSATTDHHVERFGAVGVEIVAQGVGHGAEGLVDVGVIGLAADDEQDIGLFQPVFVGDTADVIHLLVRRVAAEVGGDDAGIAQQLGHQRVGAAAEGHGGDGALVVGDEDVGLALVGAQFVDLALEVGELGILQVRRGGSAVIRWGRRCRRST